MALTDKLTAIGNAIREKTGGTDLLTLDQMPTEISNIQGGGTVEELTITSNGTYNPPTGIDGYAPVVVNVPQDGGPPESAFVLTGNCNYMFANNNWNWFIETYGNQITTNNITYCNNLFMDNADIKSIPFQLNMLGDGSSPGLEEAFSHCYKLATPPEIRLTYTSNNYAYWPNMSYMFRYCYKIQIDKDYFNRMVSSEMAEILNNTPYNDEKGDLFSHCTSLRSAPDISILAQKSSNGSIYRNTFTNCASLDDITDMPVVLYALTSNRFYGDTFYGCVRLKKLTFKMVDDAPQVINWQNQTINLSNSVGYGEGWLPYSSLYNSAKKITDDATYQALKDDPDCWTTDINYSRYNHNSAVETINSLPDVSGGSGNTIQFKGQSGALTDGGAINTLTEEEIAVATAKGWTVSLV